MSAEEARGCGDGGCVFRAPSDRGQHTNAGCRCLPLRMTPAERVGLREQIRSLVVELDEARTRLEGVGVVECLAARDAATRERERANKAERERDEAIDLLEGIPTWGPYRWRDVPETVRLKLRGNSDQIGRLIKERDAARTILDGEIRARSECERERDEARASRDALILTLRRWSEGLVHVWDGKGITSMDGNAAHFLGGLVGEARTWMKHAQRYFTSDAPLLTDRERRARESSKVKAVKAERDRLARILAVERGDESQAPEGWVRHEHWDEWLWGDVSVRPVGVRDRKSGARHAHVWVAYGPGKKIGPQRDTALECMEAVIAEQAADAAREVPRG